MNILLEISYLGSAYHGWQVQTGKKNIPTVQGTLQEALKKLTAEPFELTGCSRTDAGVHAEKYFCTVKGANIPVPAASLPYALNSLLPPDISVMSADYRDEHFHPRYNCKSKTYKYLYDDYSFRSPFYSDRTWHRHIRIDEQKMNIAAKYFEGKHDFTAFCSAESDVADKTRIIYSCGVVRKENEPHIVELYIKGNGFLYNMVRIIAGTLVDVSDGKLLPDSIPDLLISCDRTKAGMTAPSCGLYLTQIEY